MAEITTALALMICFPKLVRIIPGTIPIYRNKIIKRIYNIINIYVYNARDTTYVQRHNPATLTPHAQLIKHTQRIKRTNTEQKHKTEKHTYKNSQRTSSKQ